MEYTPLPWSVPPARRGAAIFPASIWRTANSPSMLQPLDHLRRTLPSSRPPNARASASLNASSPFVTVPFARNSLRVRSTPMGNGKVSAAISMPALSPRGCSFTESPRSALRIATDCRAPSEERIAFTSSAGRFSSGISSFNPLADMRWTPSDPRLLLSCNSAGRNSRGKVAFSSSRLLSDIGSSRREVITGAALIRAARSGCSFPITTFSNFSCGIGSSVRLTVPILTGSPSHACAAFSYGPDSKGTKGSAATATIKVRSNIAANCFARLPGLLFAQISRAESEASLGSRISSKRRPGSLAKQFAAMLLLTLIVAVAALPFVPLESGPYEKAAQAWLGEPVKIGTVNLTLLPIPQLKFEKVVIGKEHPLRAALIKAAPVITSLLEEPISLKSLELENATFPREFLPALLQDKSRRGSLGVQRISAKGLKLDIPELNLPALDVNAILSSDGALQSVAILNAERGLSVKLQPRGERAGIEIAADTFPLPIGVDLTLSEFLAKGTVTKGELALSEAEARAFGGRLLGNVRLRWSSGWSMEGEFAVRQMDAGKIAAPLLAGGTLQGKGVYSMKGLLPERMILNAQLDGNFAIQKGSITNVDMTRLLQGSGSGGGTTLFSEMSGSVSADPNRLLVRQIRMAAGLLNATGQVEMDPQKNLSGRMQVELRAQSVQARSTLTLAGTLQNPQFRRSN